MCTSKLQNKHYTLIANRVKNGAFSFLADIEMKDNNRIRYTVPRK